MCTLAHKELDSTGVEVGHVVLGCGAALDKVQVGIVLDNDERVLKLAGALGVKAESSSAAGKSNLVPLGT